jgi:hypothetical protein
MKNVSTFIILMLFALKLNAQLNTPNLISPANLSVNVSPDALLDWAAVTGATSYEYKLATTPNLSQISAQTVGTSQAGTANLLFGTVYYWQVRALKTTAPTDSSVWSQVWSFTVLDTLYLVSPLQGAQNVEPNVLLDWSPLSGVTNYDYQWDTASSFNSAQNFYASTTTSQANTFNLLFGATYYWRVRARHAVDTTQWSAVRSFTVLDTLYLVSPLQGAQNVEPNVLLDWSPLSGVTNYDYQWDTTSSFNSAQNFYASTTTSQANTFHLLFGATYYWRVRARHAVDTTQWSAVRSFTVLDTLYLVSPSNGAVNISLNPTIDWAPMNGITGYQYQYSTNINFSNASLFTLGLTSQANLINLSYGTVYFWQVRAMHGADTSSWSQPWQFTTIYQINTAPTLVSPLNSSIGLLVSNTTIQWTVVPTATFYEYQLDTNALFLAALSNTSLQLNEVLPLLQSSTKYYWRVRAGNTSGFSPWSVIWEFTTGTSSAIADLETKHISVSPNPAQNYIQLIRDENTPSMWIIVNSVGQEIARITNATNPINIESYKPGVYFIGDVDGQIKLKFIKL